MIIFSISIGGGEYGYGNYMRQQWLSNEFLLEGHTVEHHIIGGGNFKTKRDHEFITTVNLLDLKNLQALVSKANVDVIIIDVFGWWCFKDCSFLPLIYSGLAKSDPGPLVVGFDDIRYADSLLRIDNFISFIPNGPSNSQIYLEQSALYVGGKYKIFSPMVNKHKKLLPSCKKGVVVAISGTDHNYATEFICHALADINCLHPASIFIGTEFDDKRTTSLNNLAQKYGFSTHQFSDLFFDVLKNAEFLICGEGNIKFDGLELGVKTMVFAQEEVGTLPLNNFFTNTGACFLGSVEKTSLNELRQNIRQAIKKIEKRPRSKNSQCSVKQITNVILAHKEV